MGHDHFARRGHDRSLGVALALTGGFFLVEVAGGIITGSLALLSDAAHMFTDVTALVIALAAMRVGAKSADRRRTYGYQRLEILAAAVNAVLLFFVAMYILYEAYRRISSPPNIQSGGMMAIAVVGLIVNVISMRLLQDGKDGSLNVKGAYLEVWGDMLGSLGVLVGGAIIWWTGWTWVDPIIAVGIGLWVLPRTWTLLRESANILIEGAPPGAEVETVRKAMCAAPGVESVHDLHIWSITTGNTNLTAHVVWDPSQSPEQVVRETVERMLEARFDIRHTTLQFEQQPCADVKRLHA